MEHGISSCFSRGPEDTLWELGSSASLEDRDQVGRHENGEVGVNTAKQAQATGQYGILSQGD